MMPVSNGGEFDNGPSLEVRGLAIRSPAMFLKVKFVK